MAKRFGIPLLCFILMGLMACSKDTAKEEDIEEFVKNYSAERYNMKDPANPPTSDDIADRVKKYLSKEEYDKQLANRYYALPSMLAKEVHKSIEVQDLVLEEQNKNEDGSIDYTYTLKIKLYDGQQSKVYDKKGELTISQKENELKITRDFSRGTKIDGLEDGGI